MKANKVIHINVVDYEFLVIDEDRKTFFMNTYNKFVNSQKQEVWKSDSQKKDSLDSRKSSDK
jgi:hypothetical protein